MYVYKQCGILLSHYIMHITLVDFVYGTWVGKSEGWIPLTDVKCEAALRSIRGLPPKYILHQSHIFLVISMNKLYIKFYYYYFLCDIRTTRNFVILILKFHFFYMNMRMNMRKIISKLYIQKINTIFLLLFINPLF